MIFFRKRLAGCWLGIQTVILSRSDRLPRRWGQQAANPGVHTLSMTHSERQRNLMMHAQCPLPVYNSYLRIYHEENIKAHLCIVLGLHLPQEIKRYLLGKLE